MNVPLLLELNDFLNTNNLKLDSTDFDFITEIKWKTPLNLECLKCGEKFDITTKQLLRPHPVRDGLVCPMCNSAATFNKKLNELFNGNVPYTISNFKGYNAPLDVKCNVCGTEWRIKSARNLLSKKDLPCKYCNKISRLKNKKVIA